MKMSKGLLLASVAVMLQGGIVTAMQVSCEIQCLQAGVYAMSAGASSAATAGHSIVSKSTKPQAQAACGHAVNAAQGVTATAATVLTNPSVVAATPMPTRASCRQILNLAKTVTSSQPAAPTSSSAQAAYNDTEQILDLAKKAVSSFTTQSPEAESSLKLASTCLEDAATAKTPAAKTALAVAGASHALTGLTQVAVGEAA